MSIPKATIAEQIAQQLAPFLDFEITQVQSEDQVEVSAGSLCKVTVFDQAQNERSFMLKRKHDNTDYRLYQQYLEPYQLNGPKEYGYLELNGQRFLVMDYIKHLPINWDDGNGYLKAVQWLIKKDLITGQNLVSLRNLDCLGKMEFYGIQEWLPEFEQWHKDSTGNQQAKAVWRTVHVNQNRINEYIDELNQAGVQTIVHGDLHMSNILFGEDEANHGLFVIDWTQPHIGSVTKDLASLYDNAPLNLKSELVKIYRQQVDFPHFDELFAKSKVLRDVGYLAWMVGMINEGQKAEIGQNELDRVANSLISSLA